MLQGDSHSKGTLLLAQEKRSCVMQRGWLFLVEDESFLLGEVALPLPLCTLSPMRRCADAPRSRHFWPLHRECSDKISSTASVITHVEPPRRSTQRSQKSARRTVTIIVERRLIFSSVDALLLIIHRFSCNQRLESCRYCPILTRTLP